jgi:hypothetical protein
MISRIIFLVREMKRHIYKEDYDSLGNFINFSPFNAPATFMCNLALTLCLKVHIPLKKI